MRQRKQTARTPASARHARLSLVIALSVAAAALLCSSLPTHTSAQAGPNFTVTNANDAGAGSLRDAVAQANAAPEDNTIDFAIPGCAEASPCTITLTGGELSIANNGTLSINGPGASVLAVSGNNQSRVFNVAQSAVVSISGVSVKSGRASNGIGTSTNGGNGSDGGAIYNNGGTLTLTSCTVSASSSGGGANAGAGGGNGGNGGNGGGIYNNAGTLNLNNSAVSGNTTGNGANGLALNGGNGGNGGGIYNNAGTLNLGNSIIDNNTTGAGGFGGSNCAPGCTAGNGGAGGSGAGIYNFNGTVVITDNTLSNNHSASGNTGGNAGTAGRGGSGGSGGAIFSSGGTMTITGSALSGNTAGNSGDSNSSVERVTGTAGGFGGAIYNAGELDVTASTLDNNASGRGGIGSIFTIRGGGDGGAGGGGGAIYNAGTLKLTNSTLSNNATGAGGNGGSGVNCTGCNPASGAGAKGGNGGGLLNAGTVVLTNATIANNATGAGGTGNSAGAGGDGGGVATQSGTVGLRNTIIARNSVQSGGNHPDVLGAFASSGHNFIGKSDGSTGFTDGTNADQVGTVAAPKDPLIGSGLQDNGGPLLTLALSASSTAKDAGDNCVLTANGCGDSNPAVATDQRGITRPQGPTVDIGAFEVTPLTVTINQASGQADPTSAQPINFTVVFSAAVTGLGSSGISLSGSTANVASATIVVTGSGKTYNIAVSNVGPGLLQASVLANAASDNAGTSNVPSTSTDNQVTVSIPVINLVVNKTADTNDGTCDVSDCSLREAIAAANSTFGVKNISFSLGNCTPSAPCTIALTQGTLGIANNGPVSINGLGASLLGISGNNQSRVFVINAGASLSLSNLTITGGNGDGSDGGALYNNQGTLSLTECVVSSNRTGTGGPGSPACCGIGTGGMGGGGGNGGAIFNNAGILNLNNSTVSSNICGNGGEGGFFGGPGGPGGNGGAIFNNGGALTIVGSTLNNNAAGRGGLPGPLGNGARQGNGGSGGSGGAIFNSGTLNFSNSTLSGNNAGHGEEGNIFTHNGGSGGGGGAIFHNSGALTLTNATVSNNSAGNPGAGKIGGVAGSGGGVARTGGSVSLRNTIIAGDSVPVGGSGPDVFGAFTSLGHNFIGKADGSTGFTNGSNGDQAGTVASPKNPALGPLQNNGGATQTQAPLSGSPVINAGNNCVLNQSCPNNNLSFNLTADQRGILRPQGGTVEIGAVEFTPLTVTINQASGQADPTGAQPINFTVTFSQAVNGLTNSNISLSGSTADVSAASLIITGSGTTYNVAVSNVTSDGTVRASIPSNVITDGGGNANAPSASTDNVVTLDNTRPTVTINQASGQADPTGTLPINFTVVFNEPVTNFTSASVSLSGSTTNYSAAVITITGSGATYNVAVGNLIGSGTVVASILADAAVDAAGNSSQASTSTDNTVTFAEVVTNLIVNTLGDAGDGTCDSTCTLRDAVTTANATAGSKNITFNLPSCSAGAPCTITLTGGELPLTNGNVNITGPGANVLAVSGDNQSRVFKIAQTAFSAINGLTIREGRSSVGSNGFTTNNGTGSGTNGGNGGDGGGIYNDGTLVLTDCVISGNRTGDGGHAGNGAPASEPTTGGNGGNGGNGAGIFNNLGVLALTNCTVSGNNTGNGGSGGTSYNGGAKARGGAGGGGAGIYNQGGTLTLNRVTLSGNTGGIGGDSPTNFSYDPGSGGKGGSGGGIYNGGTLALVNATLSGNSAGSGGKGGNSGFAGRVTGNGGDGGSGGGLFNAGTLRSVNSTITNNNSGAAGPPGSIMFGGATSGSPGAPGTGGGIIASSGTSSTRNTIIAGNSTAGIGPDLSGAFTSLGHNFVGKADGATGFADGANGDQVGTIALPKIPLLGVLQDNGGPTQTHQLQTNSMAKDAGDNCVLNQSCAGNNLGFNLTTDQRGIARPQGAAVDIGSFEIAPLGVTVNQATGQADPTSVQPINFTAVFTEPVTGLTSSGVALSGSTANLSSAVVNVTGSGATYNIAVSGVTGTGTVVVSISANAATNSAGEPNPASTGTDNSVTLAAPPSSSIGGQVTFNNNPLASVTLTLTGPDNFTATASTDAAGSYYFSGLSAGTFTVTPAKTNYSFAPASHTVTLTTAAHTSVDFAATSTATSSGANGNILISEFRLQGPVPEGTPGAGNAGGELDEFIELYNNTDAAADISGYSVDTSAGFTIQVPANTTLPARGHYLIAHANGYSLTAYAAPDQIYSGFDLPAAAGLALLNPAGQIVDGVGFNNTPVPYLEGTGLTLAGGVGEYSYVRRLGSAGLPQDTGDNGADFILVSTDPATISASVLGAPGPENTLSPIQRNASIKASLIEPMAPSTAPPNRVRSGLGGLPNSYGTLSIQRRFKNTTGAPVTRLRFRVVDITTLNSPAATSPQADLRVMTSTGEVRNSAGDLVTPQIMGLRLEQPPEQDNGGGLNSSVTAIPPGGMLANGASIDVQFLLSVQQQGSFRFLVNVEALTGPVDTPNATKVRNTKTSRTGKEQ